MFDSRIALLEGNLQFPFDGGLLSLVYYAAIVCVLSVERRASLDMLWSEKVLNISTEELNTVV